MMNFIFAGLRRISLATALPLRALVLRARVLSIRRTDVFTFLPVRAGRRFFGFFEAMFTLMFTARRAEVALAFAFLPATALRFGVVFFAIVAAFRFGVVFFAIVAAFRFRRRR